MINSEIKPFNIPSLKKIVIYYNDGDLTKFELFCYLIYGLSINLFSISDVRLSTNDFLEFKQWLNDIKDKEEIYFGNGNIIEVNKEIIEQQLKLLNNNG